MCESRINIAMYVAVATTITLFLRHHITVHFCGMYTIKLPALSPDRRWAYGICLWEVFSFGKCEVVYNPLQLAWVCVCYCGTIHRPTAPFDSLGIVHLNKWFIAFG